MLDGAKMFCRLRIIEKVQRISMREPQSTLNSLPDGAPNLGRRNNVHAGKIPKPGDFARRIANGPGHDRVGTGGRLHSNACDFHSRDVSNVTHAPSCRRRAVFLYGLNSFVLPYLSG